MIRPYQSILLLKLNSEIYLDKKTLQKEAMR